MTSTSRSRAVRLTLLLLFVVAAGVTAYLFWTGETRARADLEAWDHGPRNAAFAEDNRNKVALNTRDGRLHVSLGAAVRVRRGADGATAQARRVEAVGRRGRSQSSQ